MTDLNGIEATRQILSGSINTKVAALAKPSAEDMLQAGAARQVDQLDSETAPGCPLYAAAVEFAKRKGLSIRITP